MYAEHQPIIQEYAERHPHGFADVVIFAATSANQYFFRMPDVIADLRTEGIDNAKWLSAQQRHAVAFITANAAREYRDCCDAFQHGGDVFLLSRLVQLPGLGFVKAGFVAQMVWGRIGCLDVHNMRALGLAKGSFNKVPTSAEYLERRAQMYIAACRQLGTPEELWNGWCRLIAAMYPQQFTDPEQVSSTHVRCIVR